MLDMFGYLRRFVSVPPRAGLLSLSLCALMVTAVQAATVAGLNEALVPVADKTDKVRAQAMTDALRQVLVKMSGDRKAVAAKPELLKNAGQYVLQYQYRDVALGEGAEAEALALWVQFDEAPLRQLLTDAGVPLWQSERPTLLLWVVIDQGDRRTFLNSEDQGPTAAAARRHAQRRGLPLQLPGLDEQARINADAVKQGDVARVSDASARYGAQAVATAVISQGQDGNWRGTFTLLKGNHGPTWVAQGTSEDDVMGQGMDRLADALAAPVATAAGAVQDVQVRVEGVTSMQNFARVESYLRTVPGVNRVVLARLEPARVTFNVSIAGGMATLTQALAASQVLQPLGAADEANYRLLQ